MGGFHTHHCQAALLAQARTAGMWIIVQAAIEKLGELLPVDMGAGQHGVGAQLSACMRVSRA